MTLFKTVGLIITVIGIIWIFSLFFGGCEGCGRKRKPHANTSTQQQIVETEPAGNFPKSGYQFCTKYDAIEAYLNPNKSYTRPTGMLKYTFANDTSIWIIDNGPPKGNSKTHHNIWYKMPAGDYLITPVTQDTVYFGWGQN